MTEIKTPYRRTKEERDKTICSLYKEYASKWPNVAPSRIQIIVASTLSMTLQGVCGVLKSNGIIGRTSK